MIIKAHGRSNARAIRNAIKAAKARSGFSNEQGSCLGDLKLPPLGSPPAPGGFRRRVGRASISLLTTKLEPGNERRHCPFEITEKHLNTGSAASLWGAFDSRVDPAEGVSYVGYPIADSANPTPKRPSTCCTTRSPERCPTTEFKNIANRASVDTAVIDVLKALPKDGHPMEADQRPHLAGDDREDR